MMESYNCLGMSEYHLMHILINHLHLIAVPQLSGSWQHNYTTKVRQAGHADEQSIYSHMSMIESYNCHGMSDADSSQRDQKLRTLLDLMHFILGHSVLLNKP